MTATIALVQHAEKERAPGDPGLTDRGHRQAEQVAAALTAHSPVAVIASPQLRARQTAAPIAVAAGRPVARDDRLRERLNLELGTAIGDFLGDWSRSRTDRAWTPPGGRSSERCGADMLAALDDRAVEGRTVVVVSHGGATTDLLRTLLGDAALDRRAPGIVDDGVPGGAITWLARAGEAWDVDVIAVVDHIRSEDRTDHRR